MTGPLDEEWPEGVNDGVSALLEREGIPNVLWGDMANNLYGVDQIILSCGFVVATEQFEAAISALEKAGLPTCRCTNLAHRASPQSGAKLPSHFPIPGEPHCLIYIAPSDVLWDILPLTPGHPNRLNLTFRCVDAGGRFGAAPRSRVLDAPSTIKGLVYLAVRATPRRSGLALSWQLSLSAFAALPCGRALQPADFGSTAIGKVLGQYWARLQEDCDNPAQHRREAQRRLDELEPQFAASQ